MRLTLMYGPSRVENTWAHRPKRLKIIKDYLEQLEFVVDIEPIQPRDRFLIKYNNITIFMCKFSYLRLHYKPEEKFILYRILWAAIEARSRFSIKPTS